MNSIVNLFVFVAQIFDFIWIVIGYLNKVMHLPSYNETLTRFESVTFFINLIFPYYNIFGLIIVD